MATQAAVDSLTDMGFGPPEKARKALTISKGNIEAAIEWFVANPDLVVGPNEDDGAEEMSLGDPSSVLDAAVKGGVVRSYKCVETGRLFATMADVELYSERTGRTNFEETTEEKKPKTKEEIAEAQAKLKVILNEKRAKREEEEKKRHREEELRRREAGKTMGQTREELEKIKRKREWEKQKKEKLRLLRVIQILPLLAIKRGLQQEEKQVEFFFLPIKAKRGTYTKHQLYKE